MQDGAPPHFAVVAREWLNAQFLGKWMGRRGSHKWPARSPDLTPCNFFSLGLVERRIREVMSFIPQVFLVKSVDAVHGRLEKLVANDGAYIAF